MPARSDLWPPRSHHQPDSAGEEHRLHDARGRAGCLHGVFSQTWPRYDRSKRRRSSVIPISSRFCDPAGKPPATTRRPASSRSITAWRSSARCSSASPGWCSTSSKLSLRRTIRRGRALRTRRLSLRDRTCTRGLSQGAGDAADQLRAQGQPQGAETAAKLFDQQGLTPRVMPMEELFAPNALES